MAAPLTKRGFRHAFVNLVPGWQSSGEGGLLLYSIGLLMDLFREKAYQSAVARFPTMAPSDALAVIGAERGIIRGRGETAAAYARRLNAWRYPAGHRVRGNAWALLHQIWAYFGGVSVWTVDRRGNVYHLDAAGEQDYEWDAGEFEFDDAPATPRWGRFWVMITLTGTALEQYDFGDPLLWADESDTLGHQGVTSADVSAVLSLFQGSGAWKPAGTQLQWVMVRISGSDALPVPDGTWGRWGELDGTNYTASRPSNLRFWSLSYRYSGDPTIFAETCDDVEGNTAAYAGDPTSFPADAALPMGGGTYAGNPASFPVDVLLPDDGA
jgi:hypothetical protein